ncbi:MAG: hypothetical protein JSS66_13300 [Armatimonadetes bacterium]|nr:hypothetical protein [Armatimonadota bacterium]
MALRIETAGVAELSGMHEAATRSALDSSFGSPARALLRTFQLSHVVTPSGDVVPVATITGDSARMRAALFWVVRGLFFRHTDRILAANAPYDVYGYDGRRNKERFDEVWPSPLHNGPFVIGQTLAYKVMVVEDVPSFSSWFLVFFGRLFFHVIVDEAALLSAGE